jgi:hypothetical protein
MMRRVLVLLAVVAAAAAAIVWLLPPPAQVLELAGEPGVRGAIHVHTRRSDGSGTPADIAAAAARAGLQFVIVTDHDDGSSEPARPYYERGVLLIEGIEVSTDHGHVLGLALPRVPYPLAGEGRDVLEDITRMGGVSIVAHPGSPKREARWTEWTAPFHGLEWLNGDSEWRDEARSSLLRALFTYPARRVETLAHLLDRPEAVLRRWDVLTRRRPVVAVAAGDAHARAALRSGEPDDRSLALHVPSYESIFRATSITLSGVTFTGNAGADAEAALNAVRRGHLYSTVDGLASPGRLSFSASARSGSYAAGDRVPPGSGNVDLQVDSNAPANARIVLLKNGEATVTGEGRSLRHTVGSERAVYRVEVHLPGAPGEPPVPWILSNPIYVGYAADERPPVRPPAAETVSQYENGFAVNWTVETSPRSQAALDVVPAVGGTQLSLRWALGGTRSESPYAALVMPAGPGLSGYDRVMFRGGADRPMRLSVQVRIPTDSGGERWARSVYLNENPRDVTIFLDEMTPRGFTRERRPPLPLVSDLLFVIDTVNTKPGSSGQIWIDDVKYGR